MVRHDDEARIATMLLDPVRLDDLLQEVGQKNHVRVVKFEAIKPAFARTHYRKVMDELGDPSPAPGLPALVLQDCLRRLAGLKPIFLPEALRRLNGELCDVAPNLRTTVGADFVANVLGLASQPDEADWIALSNNTASPAAGDTSATVQWATGEAADAAAGGARGEYTGVGMGRKAAAYAHTASTALYTMAATWTATGAVTAVRLAGMFGGAGKTAQSNGATNILFLENTFTSTTLANSDQLSLTWTVNV